MKKTIAYCGLDCAECEGYLATQENDDDMRVEVAKEWSARYNADIKPEHINCNGCLSDGAKFFYCSDMCELRKCSIEQGLESCAGCDDYPCEILDVFFQVAPQARTALDALRE